ncbi:hypothetical protein RI367_006613 [Sorochytrium milnesiophthora]
MALGAVALAADLDIPDAVVKRADELARSFVIRRSRSRGVDLPLAAACLFIAAKEKQIPVNESGVARRVASATLKDIKALEKAVRGTLQIDTVSSSVKQLAAKLGATMVDMDDLTLLAGLLEAALKRERKKVTQEDYERFRIVALFLIVESAKSRPSRKLYADHANCTGKNFADTVEAMELHCKTQLETLMLKYHPPANADPKTPEPAVTRSKRKREATPSKSPDVAEPDGDIDAQSVQNSPTRQRTQRRETELKRVVAAQSDTTPKRRRHKQVAVNEEQQQDRASQAIGIHAMIPAQDPRSTTRFAAYLQWKSDALAKIASLRRHK